MGIAGTTPLPSETPKDYQGNGTPNQSASAGLSGADHDRTTGASAHIGSNKSASRVTAAASGAVKEYIWALVRIKIGGIQAA